MMMETLNLFQIDSKTKYSTDHQFSKNLNCQYGFDFEQTKLSGRLVFC